MSNENLPAPSGPPSFLDQFNIPKFLLGPAGQAISRLIGSGGDYFSAHIEGLTKGVRDKAEAKSTVSKALAKAAAKLIEDDLELKQRALDAYIPRELRRQANKEAIARKTIELLEDQSEPGEGDERPTLDEDWLNVFERYAEDASSKKLQEMWARVLAGEIRKPTSISLKTLRFISELDQSVATVFTRYASGIINNDFIPKPNTFISETIAEFSALEEAGLITAPFTSAVTRNATATSAPVILTYQKHAIKIYAPEGTKLIIKAIPLTRVGREIASIIHIEDNIADAHTFCEILPKQEIDEIRYAKLERTSVNRAITHDLESLWRKPESSA